MTIPKRQPIPPCMTCGHLEDWPDRYGCKPWKDDIPPDIMMALKDCRFYEKGKPRRMGEQSVIPA